MNRKSIFPIAFLLLIALFLSGCGELEFGVETRLTSGRPDPVTVVVTATQQVAENGVLVTVTPTPSATLTAGTETAVPTDETLSPTPTPTETPPSEITREVVAINPTATSRPIVYPTPTPKPPRVLSLSAAPSVVTFNSTISASWTAEGQSAKLCLRFASGWTHNCYDVALNGSRNLFVESSFRENMLIELEVYGANGDIALASVLVELDCPDDLWFFDDPPTNCPISEPVDTYGAVQHFEGGWMLWLEEPDTIYAFFEPSRTYAVFYSGFGDPDDPEANNGDYDPPAGLTVPVRGFGLVWRNYTFVRDQLGWALAPEFAIDTTYQATADPINGRLYVLDEDGRLVVLDISNQTWSYR